ncbi:MAG: GAF domain-containing protein [Candidatus Aureabacteria bacterium]|nr:GAF domain-containing protein [Candidatus Auribacterota bacterium]
MPKQEKLLSNLCTTCKNVISTLDYHEALLALVKNVTQCLQAKASSVRLLDRSGKALKAAAVFGLSQSYVAKGLVEIDKSPIDKLALKGKVVQVRDVGKNKLLQYPQQAKREGIKSVLCIPLEYQKQLLGVLRIYSDKERVFRRDEIAFVTTVATQGAAVIKNAQRYDRLKSLNAIGKTITSQLEITKILDSVCQNATDNMSAKGASILLINKDTGQLEIVATYGLRSSFIQKGPIKADKSIADCFKGRIVVIKDTSKDKRIQYPGAAQKEGVTSIICLPLISKDRTIGALRVYTAYEYRLNQEDLEFLGALADFGAVAIENARLYEHIKSDYEDLTKDVWKWYGWGERQPRI